MENKCHSSIANPESAKYTFYMVHTMPCIWVKPKISINMPNSYSTQKGHNMPFKWGIFLKRLRYVYYILPTQKRIKFDIFMILTP